GKGPGPRRGDDRAPHGPADVDRGGHRGAEPLPADIVGEPALQSAKVINTGRLAGAEDGRKRQRGFDGPAARQGSVGAHAGEDRRRRIGLETRDRGDVGAKQLAYLAGDLREDPGLVQELVAARHRDDPLDALSPREREVLALMAEGRSNAGIARQLWVTEGTIEKHVRSILIKLRVPETEDDHRRVRAVITFLEAR